MSIPGFEQFRRSFQETIKDGHRLDSTGEKDLRDYSEIRAHIGRLLGSFNKIEELIETKESQVIPGRENLDPNTIADIVSQFNDIVPLVNDRDQSNEGRQQLRGILDKLNNLISEAYQLVGLTEIITQRDQVQEDIFQLVLLDNRLQQLQNRLTPHCSEDDAVVGQVDWETQQRLIRNQGRR